MFLDDATFKTVIAASPLVSIDLLVENSQGQFLLGQRTNRPAQGDWFVPGGRIRKNESLAAAFSRLTKDELGLEFALSDAVLQGPYDHFYQDSIYGELVSTHYVAIAYRLRLSVACEAKLAALTLPLEQHQIYQWFTPAALMQNQSVHTHTKAYFMHDVSTL
jgi:colanic acid biosynthesis protein WcaH